MNQSDDFAGLGMPPGLEFGEDQLLVNANFETASTGWNECQTLNLRFKLFEQIVCQAHGPVSIASNSAVIDLDLHHGTDSLINFRKLYFFLSKTVALLFVLAAVTRADGFYGLPVVMGSFHGNFHAPEKQTYLVADNL